MCMKKHLICTNHTFSKLFVDILDKRGLNQKNGQEVEYASAQLQYQFHSNPETQIYSHNHSVSALEGGVLRYKSDRRRGGVKPFLGFENCNARTFLG